MRLKEVLYKAFYFSIEHINNPDYETALSAIILGSVCTFQNIELQEVFLKKIILFEKSRTQELNLKKLSLILQYIVIYKEITGNYPTGTESLVKESFTIIKSGKISKELLPSYLLLAKIISYDLSSEVDRNSLNLKFNFLSVTEEKIQMLLNKIEEATYYGLVGVNDISPKLASVLEIVLIEACRKYNFKTIARVLKALSYINASTTMPIESAIQFIKTNQSTEGFIGFYEDDFAELVKQQEINTVLLQISSTFSGVTALLEYSTDFRLYGTLGH